MFRVRWFGGVLVMFIILVCFFLLINEMDFYLSVEYEEDFVIIDDLNMMNYFCGNLE